MSVPQESGGPGVLVLAATPIGDVRDASTRLLAELAAADVIAAEDTRRLRRLCAAAGVHPSGRVVSHHEHNERDRVPELLDALASGARVLVVTDAGMPSVSDPGFRLTAAAIQADIRVTCVPGPSAVLAALTLSGLPVDRFCFEGFLPRRSGERARALAALRGEPRTMVFFEAPHRLERVLRDMADTFGSARRAAVCRELTKTYEEVRRGPLTELTDWAAGQVRGEITIVIAGAGPHDGGPGPSTDPASATVVDPLEAVRELVAGGAGLKDACRQVAAATGASRRELYSATLAARDADARRAAAPE
ncbi:MAG: 16S rRNA (cytidine(1402)-2'-O)-methyltransferase [Dermatophilaceae bacterium]